MFIPFIYDIYSIYYIFAFVKRGRENFCSSAAKGFGGTCLLRRQAKPPKYGREACFNLNLALSVSRS